MNMNFKIILFLFAIILKHSNCNKVLASASDNDASVAVLDCSKKYPNVYYDLTRKEWIVHGADSKCFSTEKELFELCKMVYPTLNVVNVMKSDEPVKFTIYGCTNDLTSSSSSTSDVITLQENEKLKNCSRLKTKNVVPYKCLYGEFKSSELFIPPKCQFQHLYSNDACQPQDHWNLLSIEKCKTSNLVLNSSMLLKWCDASNGVATFSGIEFVCCPSSTIEEKSKQLDNQRIANYFEDEDIDDDEDDDESNYDDDENTEDDPNQDEYNMFFKETDQTITKEDITYVISKFDSVSEEKSDLEAVQGKQEQKNQYEKQKQLIINSIESSINITTKEKEKELASLYNRNGPISEQDDLNKKYEIKFNRLKEEKQRLLLQEETAYEQQVQGMLNEAKLSSAKELNKIIQDQNIIIDKQNLKTITSALYKFYIAQENDRLHMITVFKKLKAYFPEQLIERAKSIINHLETIERTMNQTTSVFTKKFGSFGLLVVSGLNEHLKRYDSIRSDAKTIINELNDSLNFKLYTTRLPNKFIKTDLTEDESISKNYEYDMDKKDDQINDTSDEDDNSEETDSAEDEDFVEPKIDDKPINIHQIKSNSSFPFAIIGICLGFISSIILIFLIIKRKRSQARQSIKHGFLPVETSNPEDRHLNSMQINGYENPTYKFYESNLKV